MADTLLAGLPRIAPVAEEVRLRGWLAVAVGASAAAWWAIQWLLDQPVDASRTWLFAGVVAVLAAVAGFATAPRRIREALRTTRAPTARVVYETRADGRDRRIRLSGAVFLSVIVVLMFDRLADWGGVTAGVVVGLAAGLGVSDIVEARRWRAQERIRDADLYVKIGPRAFTAGYGPPEIYELPSPPRSPEGVPAHGG